MLILKQVEIFKLSVHMVMMRLVQGEVEIQTLLVQVVLQM
jgi:hypothetical protein